MMGMGSKRCYKRSHTSTNSVWEWEVTHVIKHHIPLQLQYGNRKRHMLSNITYLYKMMMRMGRKRCYERSNTSTTTLREWEETHFIKDLIPLQSYNGNRI